LFKLRLNDNVPTVGALRDVV